MQTVNYNKENLELYNEWANYSAKWAGSNSNRKPGLVFSITKQLPDTESRIAFIDQHYSRNGITGMASKVLAVINKFEEEKKNLPQGNYGYVKTNSLKAWLKKNDPDHIFDDSYRYGSYRIAGYTDYYLETNAKQTVTQDDKDKLVKSWLSNVLSDLLKEEEKYYLATDPVVGKVRRIKEYTDTYGVLNAKYVGHIASSGVSVLDEAWRKTWGYEAVPETALDSIISAYEDIEKVYTAASKRLSDVIGYETEKM